MQFQIPQYIEVEDKIIGPLSLKQFVYLAGAGGIAYVLFRKFPFLIALPLIAVVVGFALALAFYPKEKFGKPFVDIVQSALRYRLRTRLYTWKKIPPKVIPNRDPGMHDGGPSAPFIPIPTISQGKLKDLSWNVDVVGEKNEVEEKDNAGKHEI